MIFHSDSLGLCMPHLHDILSGGYANSEENWRNLQHYNLVNLVIGKKMVSCGILVTNSSYAYQDSRTLQKDLCHKNQDE